MGIQIGSSLVTNIFRAETTRDSNGFIISGSVLGLDSGSYNNGRYWTSSFTNSVVVEVDNYPLASGSNGRWQFNGTDDDIFLTSSITDALPYGLNSYGQPCQVFTALIYGTIGSLTTRRALFGTEGGYNGGGDAILRTDSSPGSGKIHLDNRSPAGSTHRFTITGTSGSLLNLAIVARNNGSQSVYQDGVLVASSGSQVIGWEPFSGSSYFGFNSDTDTDNYNGQLGGFYLYGREMSAAEISQSAQAFYKGNTFGTTTAISASAVFVGSQSVYPYVIPTTTTTTAAPFNVQTLVIGGGGAGGVGTGGGGGAGGVVYSSSLTLPNGTYVATVGSGGLQSAGPVGLSNSTQSGNFGQTSSFSSGSISVIAVGGGGGAAYETSTAFAKSGGSGGGGSNFSTYRTGGSGTTGQGNAGGTVTSNPNGSGAGGGGSSQVGSGTEVSGRGAPGGSGSAYTIRDGSSVFYGGGGGAGSYNTQNGGLASAGGGQGGAAAGGAGSAGTANTGGGGGGSNRNVNGTVNGAGGAGGSGIIVIAYLTSSISGRSISGGIVTDYTSGSAGYRSHTFLSGSTNFVIS